MRPRWEARFIEGGQSRCSTLQQPFLALSAPLCTPLQNGPPGRQAEWLGNNDLATRGIWLTLVNQNMRAGEAIAEALDRTRTDWNIREFTTLPGRGSQLTTVRGVGQGRARSRSRRPARPKEQARRDNSQRNTLKGGSRVCKFYNNGRCNNGARCPDEHACWKKLADGSECRGSHPGNKCKKT